MKSFFSFPLRQRIEKCLALLLALARLLRGRSGAPGWLFARLLRSSLAILALSSVVATVAAGAEQPKKDDSAVMELDLDALAKVEVTSVSKKAQNLNDAAAAVSVISNEEIRRSGATSFAEALKYTPGLDYAQINAQSYAISSRGFQGQFANKLLVLMDGRSVYSPLFSGTYWDTQDYLLDDVERIEVIRGPGATVWGANAVNGVINLTTKSAKDTQGTLVTLGGGTEKNLMSGVRYGGKINDQTYFRVYGKYDVVDDSKISFGSDANDRAYKGQAGFRLDWEPDKANHVTFQGDAYGGRENATTTYASLTAPGYLAIDNNAGNMAGGNVLGRWTHTLSEDSSLSFQAYYDRTVRNSAILHETRDTGNFDFQHNFKLGQRQDLVWGLGYRVTSDKTQPSPFISFLPASQTDNLVSAFVQDEITLVDSVKLTLGSKIEHNDYTGVEVQPSARIAWKITDKQTLWGSVSRAVRTPSRVEDALTYSAAALPPGAVGPLPALVQVSGNKDVSSEELMAYELGYRIQPHKRVNVDVATFYNDYDKLSTTAAAGAPSLVAGAPSYILIPQAFGNNLRGEAYGAEVAVTFQASDWWRLYGQYTFMEMQLHARTGTATETAEKGTPMNQFALRSSMDFTKHWQFDVGVRYVDNIATANIGNYITADARLAWRPSDRWEISVVGQNLVDNRHPEYANGLGGATLEVERSVYGKITFRF